MKIEIRKKPYDPLEEISIYQKRMLNSGDQGASVTFIGTMRNFNEGDKVIMMELEHYAGMTETQLKKIACVSHTKYHLIDLLILHRVGRITPGDPIVLITTWSKHRREAFDACGEIIEGLKEKATFWKKETLTDRSRWVEHNTSINKH